ncbi:hypothetical protein [Cognatishimia activa]|uniref:hypothetical protein n=1 Tax=Cognatishimia activa TaxID=1715691 RepID=UPI0022325725|nr:hypothetical protein [Cognatishimia activa]UZD90428.1 hypothetical protein M0D42_12640 [Cognatishimia activa]
MFAAMPFGATAVFSANGIGNVLLLDFCAIAYVLAVVIRIKLDRVVASLWPGTPGFLLLVLCVIILLGAYFLPRIFADRAAVYLIQSVDGRLFIDLAPLVPSAAQPAQAIRFLLGALVFFAVSVVEWRSGDGLLILRAVCVASFLHVSVSLLDWVSYPIGFAQVLDRIRTVHQAILVDQHFGSVRRLIGGHTEPASFGLYTVGLYGFWLRYWFGNMRSFAAGVMMFAMLILALRSTSSATIANVILFSSAFLMWHAVADAISQRRFGIYVCLLGALPALVSGMWIWIEFSATAHTLVEVLFLDKALSDSGQERFSWNAQALSNFSESFGLGLGIGSVRASGFGFAVLGNLGWPGALVFGWFLFRVLRPPATKPPFQSECFELASALRCGCLAVLCQSALTTPYPNPGLPFFIMCGLAVGLDQMAAASAGNPSAAQSKSYQFLVRS